jgi:hypothetical protein
VHFQEILEIFPSKKEEGWSIHLIQKIFLQWPYSSQATYHNPAKQKKRVSIFETVLLGCYSIVLTLC